MSSFPKEVSLQLGYTSVSIALVTFIGNPYLPHLPASEAHQAVGEKMPKLNLNFKKLNKKLNSKQAEANMDNPIAR